MDRDSSQALLMKIGAILFAAPVVVMLFFFPEWFETLPNHGRLLALLPAVIGSTLWSASSSGSHHKWNLISSIIIGVMLISGAVFWYFMAPDARA